MGLCAVLLICLSQAELGRVWAQEHPDAVSGPPLRSGWGQQGPRRGHRVGRGVTGRSVAVDTLPDNMTLVVDDSKKYYKWQSYGPEDRRTRELWIDLATLQHGHVRIHGILSNAHRQAARVALSFDFPFYGHPIRQITIATGGFIFTGEITHRMLTATQYIAPLMANFDPSFSKNSTVKYMDNGKMFVVEWDQVRLQGREAEGPFTFQTILHSNGTIIFNYREIPVSVQMINSTEHPVKVGLSDAFMSLLPSSPLPEPKRRTIYEYHRVEVNITGISNQTAVELIPLPTCLQHTTCDLCLTSNLTTGCGWCNTLQRCSDGIDRHRQEWLDYNCPEEAKGACEDYTHGGTELSTGSFNQTYPSPTPSSSLPGHTVSEDDNKLRFNYSARDLPSDRKDHPVISENAAIIAGVVAALVVLVALTLLAVYYINTHPTVAPPFYLMQRRTNNYWPSMKFRNQGCHSSYTEVELGGHEKEGFIEAEQCC